MMIQFLSLSLYSWLLMASIMTLLWLIQLKTKNASTVDVAWSAGFAILTGMYFVSVEGYFPRKVLILSMVALWSLRLSFHLFVRIWQKPEEGRYQQLREDWKNHVAIKFFLFFQFQALLDVVLALPFLWIMLNTHPEIAGIEILAAALWLVGFWGEALADAQLAAFKKNPALKGRVCNIGLWRYSRHPNYFFEAWIWISYFLFALNSQHGWVFIYCPMLIFYFLFKLTGIPATEAQSLRSKGEAYREYQRKTSVLIPWFPK